MLVTSAGSAYNVECPTFLRLQFLFGWCRALEMAIKGKRSVGHLSSMFSVDKVLLGECSMLNTELVIVKIQKNIVLIERYNYICAYYLLQTLQILKQILALEFLDGHAVHAKKQ
jgi:hypothetical protein